MTKEINPGIRGHKEFTVEENMTAVSLGSGLLPVFSTPALVAMMENTCSDSMLEYMDEGFGTVGISLDIKHTAATPVGCRVVCDSELIEVDRRKLTFSVHVFDEKEEIGYGKHERFIIENEKFMSKVNLKLK